MTIELVRAEGGGGRQRSGRVEVATRGSRSDGGERRRAAVDPVRGGRMVAGKEKVSIDGGGGGRRWASDQRREGSRGEGRKEWVLGARVSSGQSMGRRMGFC